MDCNWIKVSPSLLKGIDIINKLEESRFEQFLKRIVTKLRHKDVEIFTDEEKQRLENIFQINEEQLLLAIKTIIYIFKKVLKFIFMPSDLKNDLLSIGISEENVTYFLKVWSMETSSALQNVTLNLDKIECDLNISWKLNTELSSEYHKRCKIPKAYLDFYRKNDSTEVELTHSELHSIFLQFETIQVELDNLISQ